jgi:hypothetical protein
VPACRVLILLRQDSLIGESIYILRQLTVFVKLFLRLFL